MMKTTSILLFLISPIFLCRFSGFAAAELSDYEVFTDGFPRTIFFRIGDIVDWYEKGIFDHHMGMFDADTRKYVREETPPDQIRNRPMYNEANHHPVISPEIPLVIEARPGETVSLDAKKVTDPDKDEISCSWWHYHYAGENPYCQGQWCSFFKILSSLNNISQKQLRSMGLQQHDKARLTTR